MKMNQVPFHVVDNCKASQNVGHPRKNIGRGNSKLLMLRSLKCRACGQENNLEEALVTLDGRGGLDSSALGLSTFLPWQEDIISAVIWQMA